MTLKGRGGSLARGIGLSLLLAVLVQAPFASVSLRDAFQEIFSVKAVPIWTPSDDIMWASETLKYALATEDRTVMFYLLKHIGWPLSNTVSTDELRESCENLLSVLIPYEGKSDEELEAEGMIPLTEKIDNARKILSLMRLFPPYYGAERDSWFFVYEPLRKLREATDVDEILEASLQRYNRSKSATRKTGKIIGRAAEKLLPLGQKFYEKTAKLPMIVQALRALEYGVSGYPVRGAAGFVSIYYQRYLQAMGRPVVRGGMQMLQRKVGRKEVSPTTYIFMIHLAGIMEAQTGGGFSELVALMLDKTLGGLVSLTARNAGSLKSKYADKRFFAARNEAIRDFILEKGLKGGVDYDEIARYMLKDGASDSEVRALADVLLASHEKSSLVASSAALAYSIRSGRSALSWLSGKTMKASEWLEDKTRGKGAFLEALGEHKKRESFLMKTYAATRVPLLAFLALQSMYFLSVYTEAWEENNPQKGVPALMKGLSLLVHFASRSYDLAGYLSRGYGIGPAAEKLWQIVAAFLESFSVVATAADDGEFAMMIGKWTGFNLTRDWIASVFLGTVYPELSPEAIKEFVEVANVAPEEIAKGLAFEAQYLGEVIPDRGRLAEIIKTYDLDLKRLVVKARDRATNGRRIIGEAIEMAINDYVKEKKLGMSDRMELISRLTYIRMIEDAVLAYQEAKREIGSKYLDKAIFEIAKRENMATLRILRERTKRQKKS